MGDGRQVELKHWEEKTKMADDNGLGTLLSLLTVPDEVVRERTTKILLALRIQSVYFSGLDVFVPIVFFVLDGIPTLDDEVSFYLFRELVLSQEPQIVFYAWTALLTFSKFPGLL